MTPILVGVFILVVLALVVIRLSLGKAEDTNVDPGMERMIHASGIYSVLRESPREALSALRPNEAELRGILAGIVEDVNGTTLSGDHKEAVINHWKAQTEANLRAVEDGDKRGTSFYYYDFPKSCPVCEPYITKGNFVTREEIYKNPQIIPPFHFGCNCLLAPYGGGNGNLTGATVVTGMQPFFDRNSPPPLPELSCTIIPNGNNVI